MTKLIDPQNKLESHRLQDEDEILHLKRLLVTMKQHYEKMLNACHVQLQTEQLQRQELEKDFERLKEENLAVSQLQQEETDALSNQLSSLKELLKNARDELKGLKCSHEDRPYLRESSDNLQQEMELLREEADRSLKKAQQLEQELIENRVKADEKLAVMQQIIDQHNLAQDDTADSNQILSYLKKEVSMISQKLVIGVQESKELEKKYLEVLNEKTALDHHCRQLQSQIDHQSANLSAFQVQLHKHEEEKQRFEVIVAEKDDMLKQCYVKEKEFQDKLDQYQKICREKEYLQDKYDQLRDECMQLVEEHEETIQLRFKAEQDLLGLESVVKDHEALILQKEEELLAFAQEKESLYVEKNHFIVIQEESESKLRIAQQHLAKKVKESTLLSEKVQELQNQLTEAFQNIESQKNHLNQLQAAAELYQKQESKLQDQLHQVMKGTESQVAKWEEKYFHMYAKWQESEVKIKELKKYEEKCFLMQNQMQSILGNFMGTSSLISANPLFTQPDEGVQPANKQIASTEDIFIEESFQSPLPLNEASEDERYDLFGMRQPIVDRYKSNIPT